ncbi:hypothetical protein FOC1_g10013342 [Fusarium oxysporum f. sp. cubense race 1]|uniref:Uncharacterized protein n=1 Tax=Fusarium oxysporum f. sp. cubense (strain race 1) TaxID=1229664 RepID=N4UBV4_FUSC1|nr:hypothetical protein FOC1_g10013342 [Fusarium oxysporum f. sp. cubense race 1]
MTSKMTRGAWFNPIVVDDEPGMTPDISNRPAHFTNNLDVIKLEDTAPLACTAPLARSPSPLASTTIYLPVRFGTMRTRNQLCRPLEGLRNKSPDEFHLKIDQAYGHFCHKFRTTQQTYLDQISPIITTENCFSARLCSLCYVQRNDKLGHYSISMISTSQSSRMPSVGNRANVAVVQFEILGIDHEYHGTEVPGMMYSSVFVRELMEG